MSTPMVCVERVLLRVCTRRRPLPKVGDPNFSPTFPQLSPQEYGLAFSPAEFKLGRRWCEWLGVTEKIPFACRFVGTNFLVCVL